MYVNLLFTSARRGVTSVILYSDQLCCTFQMLIKHTFTKSFMIDQTEKRFTEIIWLSKIGMFLVILFSRQKTALSKYPGCHHCIKLYHLVHLN